MLFTAWIMETRVSRVESDCNITPDKSIPPFFKDTATSSFLGGILGVIAGILACGIIFNSGQHKIWNVGIQTLLVIGLGVLLYFLVQRLKKVPINNTNIYDWLVSDPTMKTRIISMISCIAVFSVSSIGIGFISNPNMLLKIPQLMIGILVIYITIFIQQLRYNYVNSQCKKTA
jgi:hypothetical protein